MLKVYYDKYLLKIQCTHVQCSLIKQQTETTNVITFQKLNDIWTWEDWKLNLKTFGDLKAKGSHLFKVQSFKLTSVQVKALSALCSWALTTWGANSLLVRSCWYDFLFIFKCKTLYYHLHIYNNNFYVYWAIIYARIMHSLESIKVSH
jgi:hypothetical protein